jgi:uncharacterized protein YdhG (YjbR/CyaY superfamily)
VKKGDIKPVTVDEYIRAFPTPAKKKLTELRRIIRQLAPEAMEKISYRMPAYFLNGYLVYFAAFARHVGFYPGASGVAAFESELAGYKHARGSIQFPLDQPLPIKLIERIVALRVKENRAKK